MALDRDDIYDAINLFKYSRVGQGTYSFAKEPAYLKPKYSKLAPKVVDKLWAALSKNKISFAKLHKRWGEATPNGRVRIDAGIRDRDDFLILSLLLAHEGAHLVIDHINGFEEEIACRTLSTLYFRDLKQGVEITTTKDNQKIRFFAAQMHKNFYSYYDSQSEFQASHKLPDLIANDDDYAAHLTADWIVRSADWWGGIPNRWSETKARYIRELEQGGWPRYQYDRKTRDVTLRLLESYPRTGKEKDWRDMLKLVGRSYGKPTEGPKAIRRMFTGNLAPDLAARWSKVEPRLNVAVH